MAFFVVGNTFLVPGVPSIAVVNRPVVPGGVLVHHSGGVFVHHSGRRRYTKSNPKITKCYHPNSGKNGLGLLTVTREWSEGERDYTNEKTFDCEKDEYRGETIYVVSRKCSFPKGVRIGIRNNIKEVNEVIREDGSENELEFPNRTGVWEKISGFGNVLMIDGGQEGDNHLFYTLSGQKGWFNSKTRKIKLKKVFG